MPTPLDFLRDALADLEERGLLRDRDRGARPDLVDFASNDYLGYARRSTETRASAAVGAGASRLVTGTHGAHTALERAAARHVGADDALVFTSGYAANVGTLSCLVGPDDLVVSDALAHASIIDGIRLSKARVAIVPHLDVDAVDHALASSARRKLVVTEGLFSMDGDTPDLVSLRAVCDRRGAALVVDEAHALGVRGPHGEGASFAAGVVPDVLVGTFGKALGGQGAFVAGSKALVRWLYNRARSFVFSTGLSPALAEHALHALARAREDHEGRARLERLSSRLLSGLRANGRTVPDVRGPIVPLVLGDEASALSAMQRLEAVGLRAVAIRPPTVPVGTSRLRLTVSAAHDDADVDRLVAALG